MGGIKFINRITPYYINKESLFLKETEVHATVGNMSEETGMLTEIIVLAMLKDKHTALIQQIAVQHKVRNCLELFKGIWRVGKNKVIGRRTAAYITEDIVTHNNPGIIPERRTCLFKVRRMHGIHLDRCYGLAAA